MNLNLHGHVRNVVSLSLASLALLALGVLFGVTETVEAAGEDFPVLLIGAIFEDVDSDGMKDLGEPGFGGVTVEVFDDLNTNGAIDEGEPIIASASSFADGFYATGFFAPGARIARIHPPLGFASGIGTDVPLVLVGSEVNPERILDWPLVRTTVEVDIAPASATYRGKNVTSKVASIDGEIVDVYDRQKAFRKLFLHSWDPGTLDPHAPVFDASVSLFISISYNGAAIEVTQVLDDGSELSLGIVEPPVQNEFLNVEYDFELSGIDFVSDLCSTELRMYVRDPLDDRGTKEHVKIDRARVTLVVPAGS